MNDPVLQTSLVSGDSCTATNKIPGAVCLVSCGWGEGGPNTETGKYWKGSSFLPGPIRLRGWSLQLRNTETGKYWKGFRQTLSTKGSWPRKLFTEGSWGSAMTQTRSRG
ncbi:uncharacterized protein METZ01_LOCUS386261 [marine metagenome]|uniref:Uncharacterized protein n=1 Tax=marine metagenome TaxID=408172 RepID=A0A382UH75_9ZZZZ